jgi:hypothetical protein
LQIQLSWIDPNTEEEERREPLLETPVAIGRAFQEMPQQMNGQRVSRVTIADDLIADYHALIDWENQELIITNKNSSSGIKINGVEVNTGILQDGDRIEIGACEIVVKFTITAWECDRMVGFLFKRRCGRTDKTGCPDCDQTYEDDYAYYPRYSSYRSGWGSDYYHDEYETSNVDFTDADSVSLEDDRDADFESNMGAS